MKYKILTEDLLYKGKKNFDWQMEAVQNEGWKHQLLYYQQRVNVQNIKFLPRHDAERNKKSRNHQQAELIILWPISEKNIDGA